MKTYKITLLAVVIALFANTTTSKVEAQELKGNISISGAFALYPITVKWAEEFKKQINYRPMTSVCKAEALIFLKTKS